MYLRHQKYNFGIICVISYNLYNMKYWIEILLIFLSLTLRQ